MDRRAQRPPLESVREAPFTLARDTTDSGDGLTLDGYGAVFNRQTVIDSWEGRFREQIAPGAMKRSFKETPPKIQFDHGKHPMIGSIPIAKLERIAEEADPTLAPDGGAHIVARLFDNWLMAPVRDAIEAGAINGMSFRFSVVSESWTCGDGTPIRDEQALMTELMRCMDAPTNELPIRTLRQVKVPEMGPVVWPAYADTSVGMRSQVIDLGRLGDPEQRKLLARAVFLADQAESQPGLIIPARAMPMDSDEDPAALATALDAIIDEACDMVSGVDLSTLPTEVAQACALITAADTAADALMEAMGLYDPSADEEQPRSQEPGLVANHRTVGEHRPTDDAQRSTHPVGERPSNQRTKLREIELRQVRETMKTIYQKGSPS